MGFRYALENDKENVKNLWSYSFNDEGSFTDYYFENRYMAKYNGLWDDEGIRASLQLNPYTLRIKGNDEKTSYVVGISVYPEYRGQKLTTKLLEASFLDLKEKGENISLLMPIDTDIYRRYGYENCFDMEVYNVDVKDIKIKKENMLKVIRIKDLNLNEIKDIISIYNKNSRGWDSFIKRDESYFKELFKEVKAESGEIFISYDKKDNPSGYMIFYPKFELGVKGFVREMFYSDSSTLNSFLSIIKSHATQFKEVEIYQPVGSYLKDFWGFDNKIKLQIKPFMMSRILRVKDFLNNLEIKTKSEIKIRVIDNIIDTNNKVFIFTDKGIDESTDCEDFDFSIGIGKLTQLAMGYIDVESAVFTKDIVFNDYENSHEIIRSLNEVFFKKTSFINDYI